MSNATNARGTFRKTQALLALLVIAGMLLSACGGGSQDKVYHVGILSGLTVFASVADGIKEQMTELGYIEGENIVYDIQMTNSEPEAEEAILRQFVADQVDVVIVFPSEQAFLAKSILEGTGIPMVFAQTFTEGSDLIESVTAPGGNVTGVRYPGPDLAIRRFEILLELAPEARNIWVPYLSTTPIVPPQLEVLRPAAEAAGVSLIEAPAATADELIADLAARDAAEDIGIDAILLISEPLVRTDTVFPVVGDFAVRHHLPWGGTYFSLGGYTNLFGISPENIAVGHMVAQQVDKILQGIPAGTIPVLSAEGFLTINYAETQAMGVTVPEGLLARADSIIR
jgi:putative ABC transport system substrate-binding protein